MKQTMHYKTRKNLIDILLALLIATLFSVFMINVNFSTNATADVELNTVIEDILTFDLINSNSEYKVSARNRNITEAKIPAEYNGLPVTEIAANAFMGCTKLVNVRIPYTVKKIGNNAFYNCSVLEKINGMSKVESIGNNAFARCVKLNNLILPNSIKSLGSTILRNNPNTIYSRLYEEELNELNSGWKSQSDTTTYIYGKQIVFEEVVENEMLIGYNISMEQNLELDVDFVLGDMVKYADDENERELPILEISEFAFENCNFKSFTLKHGVNYIKMVSSDEHDKNYHYDVEIIESTQSCNHTVKIGDYVFCFSNVDFINLLVDVTLGEYVFSGSSMQRITLPNNLTIIPNSTFDGCLYLKEISNTDPNVAVNFLSSNISTIGEQAFKQCYALNFIHIPSSVKTMGGAVFSGWGDSEVKQTIHIEELYESPVGLDGYNWDMNWLGTQYKNIEVKYKTISIIFNKMGGKEDVGTDDVQATLNRDMPEATAPERDYYDFKGYYTKENGQGEPYYDENMNSVKPWDSKKATVLYAHWRGKPYTVTFDKKGGTGGTNSVTPHYLENMPVGDEVTAPVKTGYNFLGYYDPNNTKIYYYDKYMGSVNPWDLHENTTLEAMWENKTSTINLFVGNKKVDEVTATYDKSMPDSFIPEKTGQTFEGYFIEDKGLGTKYYNADMTSARNWDIDEPEVNLYAYFTPTPYTITFDLGNGETFEYSPVYYNGELPTDLELPVLKDYIFMGFYSKLYGKGLRYFDASMMPKHNMEVADNLTLYAFWISANLEYVLINGGNAYEVKIKNNTTIVGELVIPESYNGIPVTKIADNGFHDNYSGNLNARTNEITSIILPNTIQEIGQHAFTYCEGLAKVEIAENSVLTNINDYAFSNCWELQNFYLPENVTSIGKLSFYKCSKMERFIFAENSKITTIKDNAFDNCRELSSIFIPNTVISLGSGVFETCSMLSVVKLPVGIDFIPAAMFSGCRMLQDIDIPDTVDHIGENAFSYSGLKNIVISATVSYIGENSFQNCNPDYITVAKENPLYYSGNSNCLIRLMDNKLITGSNNSVIPNGVLKICGGAFAGCKDLTSINIPNSVKEIEGAAFNFCSNLRSVLISDNAELETIGERAFAWSGITNIKITAKVKFIGNAAFSSCDNLTGAIFNNVNGWISRNPYMPGSINLSSSDLSDCTIAATYLSQKYTFSEWVRG